MSDGYQPPALPLSYGAVDGDPGGTRTHATGLKTLYPLPVRTTGPKLVAGVGIEPTLSGI